jgi:5-methylcytosine-specific restriction protein B
LQIPQLANILSERVRKAERGERVTQIHLFGIEFADHISSAATMVVKASEIDNSFVIEVGKGMKLARYVKRIGT